MADIAHSYGATIEAELGHVGDNEGSAEGESGDENPGAGVLCPSYQVNLSNT